MIMLGRRTFQIIIGKLQIRVVLNLTNLGGFLPCFLCFANSCRNDLMFISTVDVFCKNIYPSLSLSFSSVYFNAKWKIITPTYTTIQNCYCEMVLEQHAWPPAQCMDLYWPASGQQRWKMQKVTFIPSSSRDPNLFHSCSLLQPPWIYSCICMKSLNPKYLSDPSTLLSNIIEISQLFQNLPLRDKL